ncbi:MAG: hypothetical protein ACOYI5_06950, partial [Christensenellales bacterium]
MRKKLNLGARYAWLRPAAIGAGLYLVVFAMLVAIVTPERYDIKIGAPAPVTIFATKDVEDTVTTHRLREEAAAAVEYSYRSVDPTVVGA